MTEKDWEDEAIEIVNERFGDAPGYTPRSAKIILEDGSEIDVNQAEITFSTEDRDKLEDLEWQSIVVGPLNIELEWAEVDPEVFDRMFADMQAEQERYDKIERFAHLISDIFMITIGSLVIAMVLLARKAEQLLGGESDE